MDINFNGIVTAIEEVDFNGDTDIQTINVDGEDVWTKAPSALQVASGLYTSFNTWIKGNLASPSDAPGVRSSYTNAAGWRNTSTHTETFSGYSISESPPLDLSPNNTAVFMQFGIDLSADINSLEVNGSSITRADAEIDDWGSVAVGYTTTALESITSLGATFEGTTANRASFVTSMVLPGKWDTEVITSSQTMLPGDIFIFVGSSSGSTDSYAATWMPSYWLSSPTLVLERQMWWYSRCICGIWCNNTSEDITATWTVPGALGGIMVRLRHTGI